MQRISRFGFALACALCALPAAASAQELALGPVVPVLELPAAPPQLSPECRSRRVAGELFRRPLRGLSRAVRSNRTVRILAIGSSSTVGTGASSPSATYVARLEKDLEGSVKGMDFDVVGRGIGGEVAQGAADRMKREVEETKPDLVVWQVGTNDAIRHVEPERFKTCLKNTLAWLHERRIDVVLVDPQFGEELAKDEHYEKMVQAVAEVAREAHVLLVDRYEAMRELQKERGDTFYLTRDNLHMNDRGYRCMSEQLARGIVGGLLQADGEQKRPIFEP
jgi:lysophospholipase L1-like esterase